MVLRHTAYTMSAWNTDNFRHIRGTGRHVFIAAFYERIKTAKRTDMREGFSGSASEHKGVRYITGRLLWVLAYNNRNAQFTTDPATAETVVGLERLGACLH